MIKKIFIIIFISFLTVSCGKKADPEYKKSRYIDKKIII